MSTQLKIAVATFLCGALLLAPAPSLFAQDEFAEAKEVAEVRVGVPAEPYPAPATTPEAAGERFYDVLAAVVLSNQRARESAEMGRPAPGNESRYSPFGLGSLARVQVEAIAQTSPGEIFSLLTLLAQQKDAPQFEAKVVGKEGEQTLVEVSPAPDKKRALVIIAEDGGYRVDIKATYGRWNDLSGEALDVAWYKLTGIEAPALANNPEFQRARENVRRVSCQSNLKQLMLGILQYSQDYDEKFPVANKWVDEVFPYVKSETIFRCPSLADPKTNYGYAFNQQLSALSQARIDTFSQTVTIYETSDLERNAFGNGEERAYRHLGGSNLAFADGHIKWFAEGKEPKEQVSFKP